MALCTLIFLSAQDCLRVDSAETRVGEEVALRPRGGGPSASVRTPPAPPRPSTRAAPVPTAHGDGEDSFGQC